MNNDPNIHAGAGDVRTPKEKAEDGKAAASMWATLSSQVITAALAVIAVEGAFITYVLDKRLPGFVFYLFIALSAISLIFSILSGGAGINWLTERGEAGSWGLKGGGHYFGQQSLACLAGVVLFFLALLFSGGTKEEAQAKDIKALQDKIQVIESKNRDLSSRLDEIRSNGEELKLLEQRIDQLAEGMNKPKRGKK